MSVLHNVVPHSYMHSSRTGGGETTIIITMKILYRQSNCHNTNTPCVKVCDVSTIRYTCPIAALGMRFSGDQSPIVAEHREK